MRNYFPQIRQARLTLRSTPLRSCLAILGILIGTASVVALLNTGFLATRAALATFQHMDMNIIDVMVFPMNNKQTQGSGTEITIDKWHQFPTIIPSIKQIAIYNVNYQPMYFQGRPLQGGIIGVEDTLARVLHLHVAQGRFISFIDTDEPVCVLGQALADSIRQNTIENPLGKQLRIGHRLFTIIGIMHPAVARSFFSEDTNRMLFIPIKSMRLISKETFIRNAIITTKPNQAIDPIIIDIKRTLTTFAPHAEAYLRSAKQLINGMKKQNRIFTLLLGLIGGISLFVGGVGVMNVMLMAVNERKVEIGIRKAVGATNHDIQQLFLTESLVLALVGGALGVALGIGITLIVATLNHWPRDIMFFPITMGFIVSASSGIFFGFYPARRAARLPPMVSLRY